ncbi:MAG: hypothetical protein AVDCRST_MAG31-1065, partial [uncultured Sphingomonas sp.]
GDARRRRLFQNPGHAGAADRSPRAGRDAWQAGDGARGGGGRCRLRTRDRRGAPCRGRAGGPAPRGRGAPDHGAGL